MTLEKQRAALKKLFGNKHTDKDGDINAMFSDLNAIQAAVLRRLDNFERDCFDYELFRKEGRICELKATDWVEVLLRLLGKWEES